MKKNKPSMTAIRVARDALAYGQSPVFRPLYPEGFLDVTEELLIACGYLPRWMQRYMKSRWLPRVVAIAERTQPGAILHMVTRKRYMDDGVREAIEAGARQLLMIGAGFDTLTVRMARLHPDLRVVEVDHPATQALKALGLERMGSQPPNLHLVPADLSRVPLLDALAGVPEWDPEAHTVTVAEGLLMYLTEDAVSELFRAVAAGTGSGSRLLVSYLPLDDEGAMPVGRLTRALLRLVGEPWLWATHPTDFEAFALERGFEVVEAPNAEMLRSRYLDPVGFGDRPIKVVEQLAVLRSGTD